MHQQPLFFACARDGLSLTARAVSVLLVSSSTRQSKRGSRPTRCKLEQPNELDGAA